MTESLFLKPDSEDIKPIAGGRRWKVRRWWDRLPPGRNGVEEHRLFDRGSKARLRRASRVTDILDEQVVFALHRELDFKEFKAEQTLIPVAVVASVLARVETDQPWRSLAMIVGRPPGASEKNGPRPRLSALRLRRLLSAREPNDLLTQMRRTVDLADDEALDVGGLAVTILDWLHPDRGDTTRSRFAYDYYAAEFPPPSDAAPETTLSARS